MHLVTQARSAIESESDEDLLLAAHAGDPDEQRPAAEAFYYRYSAHVFGYVQKTYAHTLGDDGAADLVQLTFAKAFEKADCYKAASDESKSFAWTFRWLVTIADRMFIDWLRSDKQETPLPLGEIGKSSKGGRIFGTAVDLDDVALEASVDESSVAGADPLMFTEEGRRLRHCLDELSDRDREVVLLYETYRVPDRPLRIDPEERAALLERWGMKATSLGNVQRRAREKLEACCGRHADS